MEVKSNSDYINQKHIDPNEHKDDPAFMRYKMFQILNNVKDEEAKIILKRPMKKIIKIIQYINQIQEQESQIPFKNKVKNYNQVADNARKLNTLQIQAIKISQVLENVTKILLAVESENEKEQKLQTILEEYQFLDKAQVKVKDPDQLNHDMMNFVNQQLYIILKQYKKFWKKAFQDGKIKQEKSLSSLWNDFKIYKAKLDTFLDAYPHALIIKKDDLFSLPQSSEIWQNLKKHIEEVQYDTPDKVEKIIKKFKEAILLGNAMVCKQIKEDTNFIWASMYFLMNKHKSQRQAQVFLSEADEESAFQVWNLLENGFIREAMKLILPSIAYNQKIYIPKIYKQITVAGQLNEIKNGTINKINQEPLDTFEIGYDESIFKEPKDFTDRVQIRILNHKKLKTIKLQKSLENDKLTLNKGTQQSVFNGPNDDSNKDDNQKKQLNDEEIKKQNEKIKKNAPQIQDKIIIHIHGGGFVAMSSRSHQPYTRIWANKLQVPVFSIDYGLAPKNPYPSGLNDVWQAYNWIINNIHKYFYIQPKKIILAGDSAGGNLAVALMSLIIKYKVQKPIGIIPIYPVLNLDLNRFTPSHLISLDDIVLSHWILKLCQKAYLKEDGEFRVPPDQDPQISPNLLSQEILKEFPPTRMMVGTEDPLHDDSLQFLQYLVQAGVDCKLQIFQGFPHGFLGFDPPIGVEQNYQEMDKIFKQYE
ncbi:hypothetical protein PPERSA_05060 [Pseudocohnilembus persalinus]|uniref:Alpha/beta hydrolase fold-3 domain-containing protein n=1 Tax=Pseudocohnilembus persalinus TaxID=266149 RepID=A0A0V0QVU5_PSEPJ|nr:hypothetical protein PPERSA_05060 [Pseudocohnilembus persalinus]|eukprot:KRX06447.1 hypothetical protein PPERSA_05060 [Pseudocohnilembus persalinus]